MVCINDDDKKRRSSRFESVRLVVGLSELVARHRDDFRRFIAQIEAGVKHIKRMKEYLGKQNDSPR